jgi:Nucleotidyltransferase domain
LDETPVSAVEVWIYGSAARGDADDLSDVDLLVVAEPDEEVELPTAVGLKESLSVSRYTWNEVAAMLDYGSLFLHHVKQEGRPLAEEEPPRLRKLLAQLPPYKRADQELNSFAQVVDDVREAIEHDYSPQFELAVLATAARHAAILGCYLIDDPRFGRAEPFRVLLPRLGYSAAEIEHFERLYAYRVMENRDEIATVDARDDVATWVFRVGTLIAQVRSLPR